jgi:FkbM family methyltransferase
MQTGKGEAFRRASAFETLVSRLARALPSALRARLRHLFERTLSTVDPASLVATLPGGEAIRLLPSLRQVTWNMEEYDAFRRDIRPGDVVFDVGANVGAYTLLFATWVGPSGRVFAFEPAAAPREGLERLVAANDLSSRVTTIPSAVSAAEGSLTFLADASAGETRLVSHAGPGTVSVPVTTIDAVCQREGVVPRLIKIDVEGAELDVLRGARRTIASAGKDLRLYVEMHPHLWAESGTTRAEIEAELQRQGLRAERLDGRPDVWDIEGICLRMVPFDSLAFAQDKPCGS